MNRFDGILNANPQKRYKNFITTVADREDVWINMGAMWCVWPSEEFASLLFPASKLLCIDVHIFCENYLSKADEMSVEINVFPTKANSGIIVSPQKLKEDLISELDRIE